MQHSFSQLFAHLVFATDKRRKLIHQSFEPRLHEQIASQLKQEKCTPIAINGMEDHIHAVFMFAPTHTLSKVVGNVKAYSSKWINDLGLNNSAFYWQRGYGIFSVSPSQLPKTIKYVQNQKEHHQVKTFAQEFEDLLKAHGIKIDFDFSKW